MAQAHVEGAQKRKAAREAVSASVDDFFAEREAKKAAFVPKVLKYKQLGVGLYKLYFEDGGVIPQEYSGLYTSIRECDKAITRHTQRWLDK